MSIGVGVLGLGHWGPNHVRVFGALEGCRVVTAADTDEGRRSRLAAVDPSVDFTTDYHDVLNRSDVDAVVVATPSVTHYAIVRDALDAGKHVLCEKPLTSCGEEAWELVRMAEARERVLMVGHVFLFNPGILYLGDAMADAATGSVYYLNAVRTNLGPFRSDVNAAWDLASHDAYIFNHLLGQRPAAVAAVGGSYLRKPLEDIVFLTLEYPGGVLGHIHISWLDPKKVRQITMVAEKRMVTWDENGRPGPILIYDRAVVRDTTYNTFGEFQLLAREGDVVVPRIPTEEPLAAQAREFAARCLNGEGGDARGSGRQGAEVVDILETASRSLALKGGLQEVAYGG
ncbi:Gfo/Idh/MocA family oxidoreductase [Verrucomicrobiota bacterium]